MVDAATSSYTDAAREKSPREVHRGEDVKENCFYLKPCRQILWRYIDSGKMKRNHRDRLLNMGDVTTPAGRSNASSINLMERVG